MLTIDLYRFYATQQSSDFIGEIFKDIIIDVRIDKDMLIKEILRRCGELRPNYQYTEVYKMFIDNFFAKNQTIFSKLLDTMEYDYNPIENYNRVENTTNTENRTMLSDAERINKLRAYDAEEASERDSTTDSATNTNNNLDTVVSTIKGNIGVTTTQQMIEQERNILQYNIVNVIAQAFQNEMCIKVY